MIKNENVEDCLRFAVAFGVSKLGREEVGTLTKEEIPELKEKAEVEFF